MSAENGTTITQPLLSSRDAAGSAGDWRVCDLHNNEEKAAEQSKAVQKLLTAVVLCFVFMIVELVGGYIAQSLAIMSDAAHLFSDVAGFGISLLALRLARLQSPEMTYGFARAEVLGALISTITIWLVTGVLVWSAIQRIITPEDVDGKLMFIIASIGVCVNLTLFFVLGEMGHSHGIGDHGHGHGHGHGNHEEDHGHGHGHDEESHGHGHGNGHGHEEDNHGRHGHGHDVENHGHGHGHGEENHGHGHGHGHDEERHGHGHGHDEEHNDEGHGAIEHHGHGGNMNLRSAWLHAIGDLLQNIGVMIAAALIWYNPEWRIADPIATLMFSVLVLWTTKALMSDIINVLMMRVPTGKDPAEIASKIGQVEGVSRVYCMHLWSLTSGVPILTAHINCSEGADCSATVARVESAVKRMGVRHVTIQATAAE